MIKGKVDEVLHAADAVSFNLRIYLVHCPEEFHRCERKSLIELSRPFSVLLEDILQRLETLKSGIHLAESVIINDCAQLCQIARYLPHLRHVHE